MNPRAIVLFHGGLAVLTGAFGLALAGHHPLWPGGMAICWVAWALSCACMPRLWWVALPALMPLASLAPWTGWLLFDEFDLLVSATLCGLHAQRCLNRNRAPPSPLENPFMPPWSESLIRVLGLLTLLNLVVGVVDAGGWRFSWFAAYEDAAWSLHASKGPVWALLLWPWIRDQTRQSPSLTIRRLGAGMLLGLAITVVAVLWERLAYPGLADFTSHYRTTALFWEMHVGGAALDSYLALATPFAIWALWNAHGVPRWAFASILVIAVIYVCLTTFARGVYFAVGLSSSVMVAAMFWQHESRARVSLWIRWVVGTALLCAGLIAAFELQGIGGLATGLLLLLTLLAVMGTLGRNTPRGLAPGWRLRATGGLVAVLALEVFLVLGGESFMKNRIEDSQADLHSRMSHWHQALSLLKTPVDWALGRGAGRFPTLYAASSAETDFSGRLSWRDGVARLEGPRHLASLSGLFAMTQRIALDSSGFYGLKLRVRARQPTVLLLRVCEKHLLYDRLCQTAVVKVEPGLDAGMWSSIQSTLRGARLSTGSWFAPRQGVFSIAVMNAGGAVEIAHVDLVSPGRNNLLKNRDFQQELAAWFPSAQRYYLPWHTDNLLLELLIERGMAGLLVFAWLMVTAMLGLLRQSPRPNNRHENCIELPKMIPTLLASLAGVLCVGLVSSILDVPRLSFLVFFLALFSLTMSHSNYFSSQGPNRRQFGR